MAVTPASAAASTPSGNGKKASLARTLPAARSPATLTAIRTLSTRFGWPAPTPTTTPGWARTIAFDFTHLTPRHANPSVASSSDVGSLFVTHVHNDGSTGTLSAS